MARRKGKRGKAAQQLIQALQDQQDTVTAVSPTIDRFKPSRGSQTKRRNKKANKSQNPGDVKREKDCETQSDGDEEYGANLSRKRLGVYGFNPNITHMSVTEVIEAWKSLAVKRLARPSFDDYRDTMNLQWETEKRPQFSLKGFPFLRPRFSSILKKATKIACQQKSLYQVKSLLQLFQHADIGSLVLQYISASGYAAVRNLALCSKQYWQAVVINTTTWNFMTGKPQNKGYSGVFVAQSPQYAIGEMTVMRGSVLSKTRPLPQWCRTACAIERNLLDVIRSAHHYIMQPGRKAKRTPKTYVSPSDIDRVPQIVRQEIRYGSLLTFAEIANIKSLGRVSQFVGREPWQFFQPQVCFSATRLELLLKKILQQSKTIQVLHLQQIPLLDRRLIAVILRACPNLVMLGIYDCELIQFGDVISLLDFIFEINEERKSYNLPQIQAFDFYPRYHDSTAYKNDKAAYGIMSIPQPLEIVQRGFYAVLMKAFLKAKAMGLEVLFDPQSALRSYLFRVPNPPLSVLCFLDGLHRYSFLCEKGHKRHSAKQKALYDILKPVRLGLEYDIDDDWPNWYKHSMGRKLHFCCSCGYEMPPQFFEDYSLRQDWPYSVCSGCHLQSVHDSETSDKFQCKFDALSCLFPNWNGHIFNKDAPITDGLNGLIKLAAANTELEVLPVGTMDAHGNFHRSNAREALARHHKVPRDSLQGLPLLHDLLNGDNASSKWGEFLRLCKFIDVDARLNDQLDRERAERCERRGEVAPKTPLRGYGWLGDGGSIPCHNFTTAAEFHFNGLDVKGW